jgi:fatty-acid desaturase
MFILTPSLFFYRWTDTDKDPYSAHRGFFFSHIGWTLIDRPKSRLGYADMTDLNADPLVRFQDKYYYLFALFFGVVLSTVVAGLGWNDYRVSFGLIGGYVPHLLTRLLLGRLLLCNDYSHVLYASFHLLRQQPCPYHGGDTL